MAEKEITESERILLLEWWRRARESQHSHHESGKFYRVIAYTLEAPTVLVPFGLGAFALSFIGMDFSDSAKVGFGIAGAITSLLSISHLFFRFYERATSHSILGAQYGNVRRDIEYILSGSPRRLADSSEVKAELNRLGVEFPVVPSWIFKKTLRLLSEKPVPEYLDQISKPQN